MASKLIIAGVIVAIALGATSLFIQSGIETNTLHLPFVQLVDPCQYYFEKYYIIIQEAQEAGIRSSVGLGLEDIGRDMIKAGCTMDNLKPEDTQYIGMDVPSRIAQAINPCLYNFDIFAPRAKRGVFNADTPMHIPQAMNKFNNPDWYCYDTVDQWMPPDRQADKDFVYSLKAWREQGKR